MARLSVECQPADDGWRCRVGTDAGTDHDVSLTAADLERLQPGAVDPAALVRASFDFLLEREPATSILRSFELLEIGRYFPEWEDEIRRRAGP